MAFLKQGTPQPFKISSCVCESCNKNPGTILVNGKMLCEDCKQKESTKENE
jgi:hypothetical protein